MKEIILRLEPETSPEYVYGLRLEITRKKHTDFHTHDYCEFCLVVSGNIRQSCNGRVFDMNAKQLCFVRANDTHSTVCHNCELAVIYNIGIPQKITNKMLDMYEISLEDLYKPELPLVVDLNDREFQVLLSKINIFENRDFGEYHKYILINLLSEFFFLLFSHKPLDLLDSIKMPEELPEFMKDILKNLENPEYFTGGVAQIFSMTNLSREYISRSFRKYLNCTPTEYINRLRVNYAKNLIMQENCSISEACFKSGFKSESHFFSQFKKMYFCTPRKYQESQRRTGL